MRSEKLEKYKYNNTIDTIGNWIQQIQEGKEYK